MCNVGWVKRSAEYADTPVATAGVSHRTLGAHRRWPLSNSQMLTYTCTTEGNKEGGKGNSLCVSAMARTDCRSRSRKRSLTSPNA